MQHDEAAVAIHEAGHAVAAVVLGIPLDHVTLNPEEPATAGLCRGSPGKELPYGLELEEEDAFYRKHLAWTVAGAVADEIDGRGPPDWSAAHLDADRDSLIDIGIRLVSGPNPDLAAAIDLAQREAGEILREHWTAVERVAGDLRRRRTLAGDAVEHIVRDMLTTSEIARLRRVKGEQRGRAAEYWAEWFGTAKTEGQG